MFASQQIRKPSDTLLWLMIGYATSTYSCHIQLIFADCIIIQLKHLESATHAHPVLTVTPWPSTFWTQKRVATPATPQGRPEFDNRSLWPLTYFQLDLVPCIFSDNDNERMTTARGNAYWKRGLHYFTFSLHSAARCRGQLKIKGVWLRLCHQSSHL